MLLCVTLLHGLGQYQLLGKIATHFPLPAHPLTLPSPLLTNRNFSWKSKLKHTFTKHKKYLLETSYRASETSKLELFTKK